MAFTRRSFIRTIAAGVAVGSIQPFGAPHAKAMSDDGQPNPLKLPRVFAGGTIMVMSGSVNVYENHSTNARVFGSYPGVAIVANRGDEQTIKLHNMTDSSLAVHWHGLDVPSAMDGHPMDAFGSGTTKEYSFRILNRAGTYFYHSHSHMRTAVDVYKGLAGAFIVHDQEELALGLPSGERDVPIVIHDARFDAAKQFVYAPTMTDKMEGWLGNVMLANGTPNAYLDVTPSFYRLRLVNGSNARIYDLRLSDNSELFVIAGDGGLLTKPIKVESVKLAPGERAEVLVDFSRYESGTSVVLKTGKFNVPVGHMGAPTYPQGVEYSIIEFRVAGTKDVSFTVPAELSVIPPLPDLTGVPVRMFETAMSMMGGMKHTINGKTFEMMRTDFEVNSGEMEIWELRNMEPDMLHPIHVHGPQFRVLSRSSGPLAPHETGYKDTILLNPLETIRILVTPSRYSGMSLIHCHNLEHEDDGMMLNFMVNATTGVHEEALGEIEVYPQPSSDAIMVRRTIDIDERLEIIDVNGRIVHSTIISGSESQIQISHLVRGSYNVRVGRFSTSIIKQ